MNIFNIIKLEDYQGCDSFLYQAYIQYISIKNLVDEWFMSS